MGAYFTGQPATVGACLVCGCEHESGHHTPDTVCVRALRRELGLLQAEKAMAQECDQQLEAQVAQLQTEVAARDFINKNYLQLGAEDNAQIAALTASHDEQRRVMLIMQGNNERLAGENHGLVLERDAAWKALYQMVIYYGNKSMIGER